jgi:hypothetical protein
MEGLSSFDQAAAVTLSPSDVRHVLVLKNLERGLLFKDVVQRKIYFVKWTDIQQFSISGGDVDKRPTSCLVLGIRCPFIPGSP